MLRLLYRDKEKKHMLRLAFHAFIVYNKTFGNKYHIFLKRKILWYYLRVAILGRTLPISPKIKKQRPLN